MMARHIAYKPSWRGKIAQKYNDAMGFFRIVIHFKEESLVEPKGICPKYYIKKHERRCSAQSFGQVIKWAGLWQIS